jgi:hypothetical protein
MEEKHQIALGVNEVKTIIMVFVFLIIGIVIMYYLIGLDLIESDEATGHMNNTTDKFMLAIAVVITVIIISVLLLLFKVFGKK